MLIYLQSPSLYRLRQLSAIKQLHQKLLTFPGVISVSDVLNTPFLSQQSGKIVFSPLFFHWPSSDAEAKASLKYFVSVPLFSKRLVSKDAMLIYLNVESVPGIAQGKLLHQLEALLKTTRQVIPFVELLGPPVIYHAVEQTIIKNLQTLIKIISYISP